MQMCLRADHKTWNYFPYSFRSVCGFFCALSQFYFGRWKRGRQPLNVTAQWRTELNWARRRAHSQRDRTNYFNTLVIALVYMGFEPVTSRSAARCSTNWNNRAAIATWGKVSLTLYCIRKADEEISHARPLLTGEFRIFFFWVSLCHLQKSTSFIYPPD